MTGIWIWVQKFFFQKAEDEVREWVIDPYHSQISWYVIYSGNVKVEGTFREFQGQFRGSAPYFNDLEGEVVIQVASLDTQQPIRDERLRGPEFFDVEHYPEIRFESIKLKPTFLGRFRLVGNLTIKDITREVQLDGKIRSYTKADGMLKMPRAGFEVWGIIRRSDFDVIWEEEKNLQSTEGAQVISDEVWMKALVQLVPPEALQTYEKFFQQAKELG